MKKLISMWLLIGLSIFHVSSHAKGNEESLDKMVAIVNDDVISSSELNHALDNAKMQLTQERATLPSAAVLQKQVLDKLINKKIQLQIAHQVGVQITDSELNDTIKRIAEQNQISVSTLYDKINQDGMPTTEYRSEMREQLTLQKLQQQEVASKMTISPQEISSFIRTRAWQNNGAKEYHLQDILIPFSDAPTSDEILKAKEQAEGLMTKINQGQPFEQLTQMEPTDSKSIQGGDLGWRKLPEIPTEFASYVIRMQPNTNAGPIQTGNGFHIIRMVESRTLTGKEAMASRKMVESLLLQQKFEEAVQNWVSKLRSQAFVVVNV